MNLWNYIQGFRKGKEANRIEKEAMQDPFLADALAGYEQVKGDHSKRIKKIRKQLPGQTLQDLYSYQVLGVACCLAILICAMAFLHIYRSSIFKTDKVTEYVDLSLFDQTEPTVGWKEFWVYLKSELKYPVDECKDAKGKVVLRFNINSEGHPYDFTVLEPLCPSIDKELIRTIKEGPTWEISNQAVEIEIDL